MFSNFVSVTQKAVHNGYSKFVASSGGNAGMAAAYAARLLNVPITIFVPTTTPQFMVERLKMEVNKIEMNPRHIVCLAIMCNA